MKPIIVGTAGHIDHGKTALVKALTGIDADRLEEEKRRGITIDIGFAHLELPAPGGEMLQLGFVDVPGHERFVRNMLAGVGGIDLVLLVIAADEGVKPQTVEHFQICRLLNIPRGITVLTKSDLVDAETLGVVRMEVEEFLRGSFLESAPLVAVSSRTGAGLDPLKKELARVAAEASARNATAIARLPIDRVFTMKGFGTVVTGTLVSGTVRREQELEIFPAGKRVRVRGVQVHGAAADQAVAGERTALNLAGVEMADLARGMTAAEPGLLRTTRRADVSLTLLAGAKPLKDRARVHFHCFTTEAVAEVVLLGSVAQTPSSVQALPQEAQPGAAVPHTLRPGATAYAQLRFAEPVLLLPGDRFIVRQFSPVITIGGGTITDAFPLSARRDDGTRVMMLDALSRGTPGQRLAARVSRRGASGLALSNAIAETGLRRVEIEAMLPQMTRAIARCGEVLVGGSVLAGLASKAVELLEEFHRSNPLVKGMGKEELRERLSAAPEVFEGTLESLARSGKIELSGELVRLAGRAVVMKDEEAESKQKIESAFASAGLKVPALNEVLASVKVDRARAQKIVTLLLRDRVLVKLGDDLVFHRDALETLRGKLKEYKKTSRKIDVGKFKDLTGVSRKYAIPLLEWLDRERVTRRVGDAREIL